MMAFKKLLFCQAHLHGGAGMAVHGVAKSLSHFGHSVEILTENSFVTSDNTKRFNSIILKIRKFIFSSIYKNVISDYKYEFKEVGFYSLSKLKTRKLLMNSMPDVIFIGSSSVFMDIEVVRDYCIKYEKKVVFIEVDENIYTGGCHYVNNCVQYKSGCKQCPAVKKFYRYIPRRNFRVKESFLSLSPIIASLSPFDRSIFEGSFFRDQIDIELQSSIYLNTLDFEKYRLERDLVVKNNNQELNVSFVCNNYNDKRKGIEDLILIANSVFNIKVRFHLFGDTGPIMSRFNGINKIINYGFVDKSILIKRMAESDVFLNLTKEDRGPASLVIALQLGIPVISYKVGMARFFMDKNDGFIIDKIGNYGQIMSKLNSVDFRSYKTVGKLMRDFYDEERLKVVMENFNKIIC
jgi:glycosyltransferase involved in cell wall biosynthesis